MKASTSTEGVAQAEVVAASEVFADANGDCDALGEGKNSQGSHEHGLYGFNGETIHEDLGSLNGVPLYASENEDGVPYKEDLPEDMDRRIQDKNKQEYIEYENTFADSELKPQDDHGAPSGKKHYRSFSSFVLKYSKPHVNSGEVKPKDKGNLLDRLFSKDLYKKLLHTAPSVKVRYVSSFVLTLLVIVGLFIGIWGGIYSMSYVKLSSLGTLAQAKIVVIDDDYVHKKESRNLDRVEHHFIEIVEFKLDDGSTLRTPLYLNGNRDSTDVRPVGTTITILYKNDDPHSLIDAKNITPFFTSVLMAVIGVTIAAVGIFFLVVLNLRFFRHHVDSAIKSCVLSLVLITTSLVFISEHFEDNLHWLYSAASEDEVYYNDQIQLLVDKKSNKPYSGLVRTLHNGIFTISDKQQPEAIEQEAENKPSESQLKVRSNISNFSESYNLLKETIYDLDREIHESLLQAEALGQSQSLNQSLALNSNVNNEVGVKETYNARHKNIRMPANTKEEMSIRDYALSHPERSVNTNINVDKLAQSWALRNLSDYNYSLNNSSDKRPSLLETNPGAITWSHEALHQPPANRPFNADAINNKLVPFDHAIKGLLLMALHNWIGESVISIPGVDVPVKDLVQYGDGVYSDTSFAWMRYPDNFIITVAISKPQLQPNAVLVRGFENSALQFDPYQVIYRTKQSFMTNHKKVQPFVISVTYHYSAK